MPASMSLELRGLKEAQDKAIQVATDLHGAPMVEAMRDCTLLVTRTGRTEASVDTGRYRASVTPEVRVLGETVEGVVGSNVVHAPFAVLGTKPHWPPIAAIQAWVHRKGLGGRDYGHGRIRRATADIEAGIAFLIARKISRSGTKGDRSLITAIESNAPAIYRKLEAAVGGIVEK